MDEQLPVGQNRSWLAALACVGCLPCLLAVCCTQRVPAGQPVTGEIARPALAFAQYAVDLHQVPVQPVVHGHFDFWNRGAGKLTIDSLDPSCACLAPQLLNDQRDYEPGEQGRFYVKIRTANETPGAKVYQIRVNYTCEGQTAARWVTFRATLPAQKISIEPPQLVFYQVNQRPGELRMHVADYRGQPLQVTDVTCANEFVEATILDREVDAEGQIRIPIAVAVPADVPPGRTNAVLTVHTNDPDFPKLQVPVFIFGDTNRVRMASGVIEPADNSTVAPAIQAASEDATNP